MAVIIASFIEPLIIFFKKRGLGRGVSVTFSYSLIVLIIASFVIFVVPPLIRESISAINSLPATVKTTDILNPIQKGLYKTAKNFFPDIPQTISIDDLTTLLTSYFSDFAGGVFDTISRFFGGILTVMLVLVLSIYLSVEEKGVSRFLGLITPREYERYVVDLWDRVQTKIGRWIQGQFLLMGIMFIIVYASLHGINYFFLDGTLKHIFLISLMAGIMKIFPIIGTFISTVFAFLLAFISGGILVALLILLVFTIIHQVESNIIYPIVIKKVTGVPPILVIISLIAGIELAGFIGIIMSIPVAVLIVEFLDDRRRVRDMMIDNET